MSSPSFRTLFRRTGVLGAALLAGATFTASASAYPIHTVVAGESLSSIATANGLQLARLAAANDLSWDAQVVAGTSLQIPPVDGAYTSKSGLQKGYSTSTTPLPGSKRALAAATSPGSAPTPAATSSAPSAPTTSSSSGRSGGSGHQVQPGDTLSGIAARLGVSPSALAAANGIANPDLVISGTTLRSPGANTTITPAPAAVTSTGSGPEGRSAVTGTGATPTAERLSSSQISSIAAQHGAPGNLAAAIAWQESGNNNAMVSSAGARGVMQIMPGTWDWINSSLATPPLNRASATDNVRAGSLFIKQLLAQTGGDEATAIAGYYQGLGSVRQRGLYDDTKQYVRNVQAIRARLGG